MDAQAVQTLLLPTLFSKPLVAAVDTPHQSSDGGAILRKAIDREFALDSRRRAAGYFSRTEGMPAGCRRPRGSEA